MTSSAFLFLFAFSTAQAADVGRSFDRIPKKLIEQGIEQVGALDLKQFLKDAESIEWTTFPAGSPPPRFARGRRSAYFLVDGKTVHVSSAVAGQNPSDVSQLELHEAFGALGYNDKNYGLSTSLEMLSLATDDKVKTDLRKDLGGSLFDGKNILNSRTGEGSGSSVGGGGDLIALTVKNRVLRELMKSGSGASRELLRSFPFLGFEPMYQDDQQFVAVKYNSRDTEAPVADQVFSGVPIRTGRFEELISIYVPVHQWTRSEAGQKEILEQVQAIARQVFPVKKGPDTSSPSTPDCKDLREVHFPFSSSTTVQYIQETRARLLRDCPLSPKMEIRAPSFRDERGRVTDVPLPSDRDLLANRYYACRLSVENGFQDDWFEDVEPSPEGRLSRHGWNLTEKTFLVADTIFDAKADLAEVVVREIPLGANGKEKIKVLSRWNASKKTAVFKTSFGLKGQVSCAPNQTP